MTNTNRSTQAPPETTADQAAILANIEACQDLRRKAQAMTAPGPGWTEQDLAVYVDAIDRTLEVLEARSRAAGCN